jgi:hypothetical protein
MSARNLYRWTVFGLCLAGMTAPAAAQDAYICLATAERASDGETLDDAEKKAAHEACLRALSDTASVIQKYQFQEADFAIMGTHHKF